MRMSDQHHDDVVTIVVVRTGGIAGMRRQWQVEADEDADRWLVLIESCPWDEDSAQRSDAADLGADAQNASPRTGRRPEPVPSPEPGPSPTPTHAPTPMPTPEPSPTPRSADRYIWRIHVRTVENQLEQDVPESDLVGPWRTLVDAVRSAG